YLLRILQVKKIPFSSYDLASDESAKRLWKRKAPLDKQQLPGILVGNKFPGSPTQADAASHSNLSEDAVECDDLATFLRLNETWYEDEDQAPIPVQPIGVPGAVLPLQMTPERLKKKILAQPPAESPLKGKVVPVNKRDDEFDISTELEGYGLQGVNVTEDDLRKLVAELGLGGDEAGDLAKELTGSAKPNSAPQPSDDDRELPTHQGQSGDVSSQSGVQSGSENPAKTSD
ncbi:hypothetical protein H0H93_011306, partial [Arthromyces matolae]